VSRTAADYDGFQTISACGACSTAGRRVRGRSAPCPQTGSESTIGSAWDQLAIAGGVPACPLGPPRWPPEDADVHAAIERAYADGSWGRYHGPYVEELSGRLAQMHGLRYVLPCSSGTIAIEVALRAVGVAAGDEVILAGYDFPGNFRAIEATGARPVLVDVEADGWLLAIEAIGARPVLVDVDPASWGLDPAKLPAAIGPGVKAILVSHLHGGIVPMRAVSDFARRHQLAVVEDACQSSGAVVEGRPAGSWGDAGVLSFGGSKLLTAGRGGAVLTDREDVHQRAKIFCHRGNHAFPLSELQAAVLNPQLGKLAARSARRAQRVEQLRQCLGRPIGLRLPVQSIDGCQPAYYKLGMQFLADEAGGRSRDEFIAAAVAEGVAIDAGFRGFFRRGTRRCRQVGRLPHSRAAAEGAVVLHHPVLLEPPETIHAVAEALLKVSRAFAACEADAGAIPPNPHEVPADE